MREASAILRMVFGLVFVAASVSKLVHPAEFATVIVNYQILPDVLVNPAALVLPWVELVCGLALATNCLARGAAFVLNLLLLVFLGALWFNVSRGLDISCGCFTVRPTAQSGMMESAVRDTALFAVGLVVLWRAFADAARAEASAGLWRALRSPAAAPEADGEESRAAEGVKAPPAPAAGGVLSRFGRRRKAANRSEAEADVPAAEEMLPPIPMPAAEPAAEAVEDPTARAEAGEEALVENGELFPDAEAAEPVVEAVEIEASEAREDEGVAEGEPVPEAFAPQEPALAEADEAGAVQDEAADEPEPVQAVPEPEAQAAFVPESAAEVEVVPEAAGEDEVVPEPVDVAGDQAEPAWELEESAPREEPVLELGEPVSVAGAQGADEVGAEAGTDETAPSAAEASVSEGAGEFAFDGGGDTGVGEEPAAPAAAAGEDGEFTFDDGEGDSLRS